MANSESMLVALESLLDCHTEFDSFVNALMSVDTSEGNQLLYAVSCQLRRCMEAAEGLERLIRAGSVVATVDSSR